MNETDRNNVRIVGSVDSVSKYGAVHSVTVLPNENKSSCSCRTPDIRGLPCQHAVGLAVIHQVSLELLIHPCFKTEAGFEAFGAPAQTVAVGTADLVPQPPEYKLHTIQDYPTRGRPPSKRKKAALEPAGATKRLHRVTCCSICKQQGHTKRTCSSKKK